MGKIVTFGEMMLRLSPEGYLRFTQAEKFLATYGGAEANVAISMCNYGMEAAFVSKLPDNAFGDCAIQALRKFGVDTTKIIRGGARMGLYFAEKGASQRPSKVVYDRAGSAIATASHTEFKWEKILKGATWFHFTGITPALSDEVAKACEEALKVCKKNHITVSCDLNFRKKLWSREKANKVMTKLAPYIDVCIANEEDASDVFGISAKHTNLTKGELDKKAYEDVAKQLVKKFGFKKVAITLRTSLSASDNLWAGMLYDGKKCYLSRQYPIHIVDRVGGGDSFGSGLIYALSNDYKMQDAVEFAVAASCLKQTIEGDYNLVSVSEVEQLAGGDGSGRVQR